jgi:hypothetical protein
MMVNEAQMECAELSVGNEEFHISIWIFFDKLLTILA